MTEVNGRANAGTTDICAVLNRGGCAAIYGLWINIKCDAIEEGV